MNVSYEWLRAFVPFDETPAANQRRYFTGVSEADRSRIAPESFALDDALTARRGIQALQLDLLANYILRSDLASGAGHRGQRSERASLRVLSASGFRGDRLFAIGWPRPSLSVGPHAAPRR